MERTLERDTKADTVERWMSPAAMMVSYLPAEVALGFMEHREVNHLIVVEAGKIIGVVSKSHLLSAVLSPPRGLHRTVADVMKRHPPVVSSQDSVERATAQMRDRNVSFLPVLEAGRVVGALTSGDLLRALAAKLGLAS
ncbi:MAG: CBS domain-containing protein [Planctomycetes bacterium]|nr:CBS domain-containing protein [Planctomycetota bacterium]